MVLIGMLFVGISGLMYFAFMAAWLGLFLVVGGLPWVTGAAGGVALVIGVINVKDFVAFARAVPVHLRGGKADIFQRAQGHPEGRPPAGHAGGDGISGRWANFYELLCTAVFRWSIRACSACRCIGPTVRLAGGPNLIYVLPLAAIVLVFVRTMGAAPARRAEGGLKLLSGLMMLGLALCLVLAPRTGLPAGGARALLAAALGLTGLAGGQ